MKFDIEIDDEGWKQVRGLRKRAEEALALVVRRKNVSISVLFSSDSAVKALNRKWRGKNKPTNVLSFPAAQQVSLPRGEPRPLGDIILAHGVVAREATAQRKLLAHHTMHLLVHGALHLLDYDHETDDEAKAMEQLEIRLLARLGIENPYRHE